MFDTVCSYPLSSDLFAQAIHPTEPLVTVGLTSGHVQTFRLPPTSDGREGAPKNGFGHIDAVWRTRRHKGSCRCLSFGIDGQAVYSAGTDGWIKAASAETGVVEVKIAVPRIGERYALLMVLLETLVADSSILLISNTFITIILQFKGLVYNRMPRLSSTPSRRKLFSSAQTRVHFTSLIFVFPHLRFRQGQSRLTIRTMTSSPPSLHFRLLRQARLVLASSG